MADDSGPTGWRAGEACAIAHAPMGRQQTIVGRLCLAKGCAGKPRDDLAAGGSPAVPAPASAAFVPPARRARSSRAPRIGRCRFRQRVGDLVAIFRIGPGVFAAAALAHGVRQIALKSQKNGKGVFEPHSSPMNSIGIVGANSSNGERGLDRPRVGNAFEPVAERAVADLVVVLQEIDEGGRRACRSVRRACRREMPTVRPDRQSLTHSALAMSSAASADSRRNSLASRRSSARARHDDSRRSIARDICRAAGPA